MISSASLPDPWLNGLANIAHDALVAEFPIAVTTFLVLLASSRLLRRRGLVPLALAFLLNGLQLLAERYVGWLPALVLAQEPIAQTVMRSLDLLSSVLFIQGALTMMREPEAEPGWRPQQWFTTMPAFPTVAVVVAIVLASLTIVQSGFSHSPIQLRRIIAVTPSVLLGMSGILLFAYAFYRVHLTHYRRITTYIAWLLVAYGILQPFYFLRQLPAPDQLWASLLPQYFTFIKLYLAAYLAGLIIKLLILVGLIDIVYRAAVDAQREAQEHRHFNAMRDLIFGLNHTLRQPLGILSAQVPLLEPYVAERGSRALARIKQQIAFMQALVEQLLDMKQHQAREGVFLRIADIPAARLTSLEQRRASDIKTRSIHLRADVYVPRDLTIRVNDYLLASAIDAILDNALDAAGNDSGGDIVVAVKQNHDGTQAYIDISNSGPPISPIVQERMFQPFFTTKPQGSGIGLFYAKAVLEAQNATLSYIVSEDRGTFRIAVSHTSRRRDHHEMRY